jgi:CheY-like chemotaxis protein
VADAAALDGLRVLVVEDEFLIALDLCDLLAELGCIPLGPAATVAEALALVAAEPPDAVTLDVNLNGIRATPVAEALATLGIPFAVVSAHARSLIEPVFSGVPRVPKPYSRDQIEQALGQLTGP